MNCKEMVLFSRQNKGKLLAYMSVGVGILFSICSVIYLLIAVNSMKIDLKSSEQLVMPEQPMPLIASNAAELHNINVLCNTTNLTTSMATLMTIFANYKREVAKNLSLITFQLSNYSKEAEKKFTMIHLNYSTQISDHKKELSNYIKELSDHKKELSDHKKELSDHKKELSDHKKELSDSNKNSTGFITNLTNSMATIRLLYLGNKAQITKKLSYLLLQNNNITRNFEKSVDKLNTLLKINNNTISDVSTNMLSYLEEHKNDAMKNITRILQIMGENEAKNIEREGIFDKRINSSLEGRQLFWGKECPDLWTDVGGVYPVKVCKYSS